MEVMSLSIFTGLSRIKVHVLNDDAIMLDSQPAFGPTTIFSSLFLSDILG